MALRARVLGLAARAVEQCLNSDPSDGQDPVWPCHCGQTARRAGRRAKTVVTALGPLRLERAYYHCSACASGFFPRDRLLGLEADSLSPAVHRMNGVAAAHSSFGEASDLLHELAGLSLNPKRSERAAKALGLEIRQDEQEVVDRRRRRPRRSISAWTGPACRCVLRSERAAGGNSPTVPPEHGKRNW